MPLANFFCFSQHDRTVTSVLLALLLPSRSHTFFFSFFFWHDKSVRGFTWASEAAIIISHGNKVSQVVVWSVLWDSEIKAKSWGRAVTNKRQRRYWTGLGRTSTRWDYSVNEVVLKAVKYEIQKPLTCRATLFLCYFSSMFSVFHLAWSTCRATKTSVAGWKKLLRKVEGGSTLSNKFLVFHQTHNLSRKKFARDLENQPISAPHFFNPQQMFLLRVKLIAPGEKREHWRKLTTKQCCATSWGFCISYFSALTEYLFHTCTIPGPTHF